MTEEKSQYDVIIIGAGVQGLVAAKTFLQCDASLNLRIIDSGSSIGGVWRKEALYEGLRTNNQRGTYEFSDFPMSDEFGVEEGEHIPGVVLYDYLCKYAEKHGLTRRCMLETKVEMVEQNQGGWALSCHCIKDSADSFNITCSKLVVATGLTSSPTPIELKGSEAFRRPIINFASLPIESSRLLKDNAVKHVTVFGGGKASFDTVYLFASHGKRVTWIMRASGHGPIWMATARVWLGPLKVWLEPVITARFVTFLSPCIWGPADGFGWMRSLFHNTRIGRWVVRAFNNKLSYETLLQTGLLRDERLKSLIPNDNATWYGAGLGILNYPTDIHDFILSGQVQVLRKDIEKLGTPNTVHFSDPETPSIQTDALICSMGWNYSLPFDLRPQNMHASLGIPSLHYTKNEHEAWSNIEARADTEILSRLPSLAKGPRLNHESLVVKEDLPTDHVPKLVRKLDELTPWRLWRGIAPPGLVEKPVEERNVVFLGMMLMLQTIPRSEISALWAYAWMNGRIEADSTFALTTNPDSLQVPDIIPCETSEASKNVDTADGAPVTLVLKSKNKFSVFYDTALFNRYSTWRHPYGYGYRFPDFTFDGLAYLSLMLRDLGVRHWRKGRTALGEIFSTGYLPRDYRGIVEEWKHKVE